MEKIYKKNEKGRYVECGYDVRHSLSDGIWLVDSKPNSKSTTSLLWRVGDVKKPVDVVTAAALEAFSSKLSDYLMKLTEEGSEELKEAKNILGGYLYGAVGFSNISASDLSSLFLRRLALECGETYTPESWMDIFWRFRNRHTLNEVEVSLLYKLADWLEENKYKHYEI